MLAAGTIAALSFGSLAAFGLPTIKNFGLCTAFGILAALTVEMTFIPAIRVLMSPPSARQTEREKREEYFDPILEKLADVVRHRQASGRSSGCSRALIVVALHRRHAPRGGQQPGRAVLRGATRPVHGFRMADSRLAGTRVIQVLVEGDAPDAIKNPDGPAADGRAGDVHRPPAAPGRQGGLDRRPAQADEPGHRPERRRQAPRHGPGGRPVPPALLAWAATRRTSPASSTDGFQRAVITAYLKTDDFRAMKAMTVADAGGGRPPVRRACRSRRASAAA